jgi:hypothetical protein
VLAKHEQERRVDVHKRNTPNAIYATRHTLDKGKLYVYLFSEGNKKKTRNMSQFIIKKMFNVGPSQPTGWMNEMKSLLYAHTLGRHHGDTADDDDDVRYHLSAKITVKS